MEAFFPHQLLQDNLETKPAQCWWNVNVLCW